MCYNKCEILNFITTMLFSFLQKQHSSKNKQKLIWAMIASLSISPDQKELYFQALKIMNQDELDALYQKLTKFVEKIEMKELEEIKKDSFWKIAWMRKKEAEEKLEEMNNFSFLLNNL